MTQYGTWVLFALMVATPAAGQTSDTAPRRVQGLFRYGPETCKKRCAYDTVCLKECSQHDLTPDELRATVPQKEEPKK
jgi:hypothetical protein